MDPFQMFTLYITSHANSGARLKKERDALIKSLEDRIEQLI